MSQHRRLNPTVRPPRRKPVPAYQVRHRHSVPSSHSESAGHSNGHAVTDTADQQAASDQRHVFSGDTEAFEPIPHAVPDTGPTAQESSSTADDSADDDYASYVESVEAAAARSRSQVEARGGGVALAPPIDAAGLVPDTPVERKVKRVVRTGSGSGAPPGTRRRTRNGKPEREPDSRPLFRRPKTWFVIVAMLFAVSALVVVLWSLNLARATYDAYNDIHVEPTPRTVFTINPEGTPVPVPTEEVEASLPNWDTGDPFNVLLLGVDDRDGEDEPIRSDTMIVVRVDPTGKTVTMMSIPRDLYVWIPGFRHDKINAAYPLGEFYEVPGGGVATAAQTIEANFGIQIHYFITVDFTGFKKIVDTIGGVIIDVPAPVKDDQYPTETYGLTRAYFPTGLQRMDGTTALRYSRTRHGDNDIARGERQQQILLAIRSQALNLGLVTRAESLIRDMGDTVRTDLNFNQMLALANLGRQIDGGNIVRINLWEDGLIYEHWPDEEDDAFYFEADWDAVWGLAAEYFSTPVQGSNLPTTGTTAEPTSTDNRPVDLSVPVLVLNASTTDLIATNATRILVNAGYSDVTPQNATTVEEQSIIYDYVGDPETAAHIARRLGIDESQIEQGSGGDAIVVVLGEDFAASQ